MIIILLISAVISCVTAILENEIENLFEGLLIFAIVIINAIVGVIQEQKAENALLALKKFTFALQFFGLIFAIIFQFPGMDALARCGLGSVSYPLLVGSCLVGFSLYSMFILKEKNSLLQFASLGCCLAGIIMICL